MRHSEKLESISSHEIRADRKHQTGHAHGEQQQQRKHVVGEGLYGKLAFVAHAQLHRQNETKQHQHCGEVQQIEMKKAAHAVDGELFHGVTVKVDPVIRGIVYHALKVDPSKHQRKRDSERQHATP